MTNPDIRADYLAGAYAEERAKLAAVTAYIRERIERIDDTSPAEAAYHETAEQVQEILDANQDSLEAALEQPYTISD